MLRLMIDDLIERKPAFVIIGHRPREMSEPSRAGHRALSPGLHAEGGIRLTNAHQHLHQERSDSGVIVCCSNFVWVPEGPNVYSNSQQLITAPAEPHVAAARYIALLWSAVARAAR